MICLDGIEGRITAERYDRIIAPWREERAQGFFRHSSETQAPCPRLGSIELHVG